MEHPRKDFNCNGAVKHSPEERAPCLEPTMKTKKNSLDKVDVTVHLYNNTGCSGQWTSREKYLTAVCVLLFCACIAFVAVAFIRDREGTYLNRGLEGRGYFRLYLSPYEEELCIQIPISMLKCMDFCLHQMKVYS